MYENYKHVLDTCWQKSHFYLFALFKAHVQFLLLFSLKGVSGISVCSFNGKKKLKTKNTQQLSKEGKVEYEGGITWEVRLLSIVYMQPGEVVC